ncbi:MAG: alpha/beta hydrolase [Myxococcales bacterium]|nr:alpha/beta hydrolase [Myxococcales bacterium]
MTEPDLIGPSSNFYISQRLRLHYVDWGNEDAPLLLLIHGGRDHARSWDWVARELRRDYHVVAPDLRGHGDSAWSIGGNYGLMDFVLDITRLVEALGAPRLRVVGHSLGGNVALHYAGLFPERVSHLVAVEGLGPAPEIVAQYTKEPANKRLLEWIEAMQGLAARMPRRYASIDEAADRMQTENSFLSHEQARHLTVHGVARNEDGTFSWKFDNYVRVFSPARLRLDETEALWTHITAPTLLMRGMESWASDPEEDGRARHFQNARVANVASAGHWVHHDQLGEFLELVRPFFRD